MFYNRHRRRQPHRTVFTELMLTKMFRWSAVSRGAVIAILKNANNPAGASLRANMEAVSPRRSMPHLASRFASPIYYDDGGGEVRGSRWQNYATSAMYTDSGYASMPSESRKDKEASQTHSTGLLQGVETVIEESEPPQEASDSQSSDGQTNFTSASSVDPQWVTAYISRFSQDLLNAIPLAYLDETAMECLEAVLPEFLKEFSLKMGHNPPTDRHREIMYFVRKHRW